MSVLGRIEDKLAGLVEGTFSRAFKSEVAPVEIARKLIKEMERNKTVSISCTYAPNEYTVFLSSSDYQRLKGFEPALTSELSSYLLEHARAQRLSMMSRPAVVFQTDERLELGTFGIQARLVNAADAQSEPVQGGHSKTMVYANSDAVGQSLDQNVTIKRTTAIVTVNRKRIVVQPDGAVLGRSRDCDISLHDPNVSRHHAQIYRAGSGWAIKDLGSTNGVVVNGRRIDRPEQLKTGSEIQLGTSMLRFGLE